MQFCCKAVLPCSPAVFATTCCKLHAAQNVSIICNLYNDLPYLCNIYLYLPLEVVHLWAIQLSLYYNHLLCHGLKPHNEKKHACYILFIFINYVKIKSTLFGMFGKKSIFWDTNNLLQTKDVYLEASSSNRLHKRSSIWLQIKIFNFQHNSIIGKTTQKIVNVPALYIDQYIPGIYCPRLLKKIHSICTPESSPVQW